jgi:hypothetical protein
VLLLLLLCAAFSAHSTTRCTLPSHLPSTTTDAGLQETGTGYDKPFQHIARLVQKAYETEVSHAAELVSR